MPIYKHQDTIFLDLAGWREWSKYCVCWICLEELESTGKRYTLMAQYSYSGRNNFCEVPILVFFFWFGQSTKLNSQQNVKLLLKN